MRKFLALLTLALVAISASGGWFFGSGAKVDTASSIVFSNNTTVVEFALHYVTVPAATNSTGLVGELATDTNFLYVCISSNTWRRIAWGAW